MTVVGPLLNDDKASADTTVKAFRWTPVNVAP